MKNTKLKVPQTTKENRIKELKHNLTSKLDPELAPYPSFKYLPSEEVMSKLIIKAANDY